MLGKGLDYARYTGVDKVSRTTTRSLLSKHWAPPFTLSLKLRDPACALEDTSTGLIITAEAKACEERLRRELEKEEEEAGELQAKLEQNRQRATRG